jgi:hypothetical protein
MSYNGEHDTLHINTKMGEKCDQKHKSLKSILLNMLRSVIDDE